MVLTFLHDPETFPFSEAFFSDTQSLIVKDLSAEPVGAVS